MKTLTLAQKIESFFARLLMRLPAALLRIIAGKPVVRDGLTLDVQCQLLLKLMKSRGFKLGGGKVDAERRAMDAQSRTLEPRASHPIDIRNIQVAGADGAIDARLYRPGKIKSRAPALMFIHGGGFVLGSLDSHDGVCQVLAERAACVVIAVAYRLAPEHPAPAAANDCVAAFRDIVARADEFDIDPAHVAVSGDSAGGNLSAVVAQQTRSDSHPPCFQLLFYPTTDFAEDRESVRTFASGFLLEKSSMDWFRGHYIPDSMDNRNPLVSPIYGDVEGVAPALVITGGFDPLRDEGEAYAKKLEAAGIKTTLKRESALIHGFLNAAGGVERADHAIEEAAATLKHALRAA